DDIGLARRELFEDAEHQLLLAHGAGVFDLEFLGERDEFARSLGLEVLEFHFPHAGRPGKGGDGGVEQPVDAERRGIAGLEARLSGHLARCSGRSTNGPYTKHLPAFGEIKQRYEKKVPAARPALIMSTNLL